MYILKGFETFRLSTTSGAIHLMSQMGVNYSKTADSSVICDYADIYNVVDDTRLMPISLKGYFTQSAILVLPFIPMILTEHSLRDILTRAFETLI